MRINRKYLRDMIRSTLLEAPEDDISNADLIKGLKTGAGDIANSVPAKLNDDFAAAMKGMVAMAQFDKAKFEKVKGYIDQYAGPALEKADKGEDPKKNESVQDFDKERSMKITKNQLRRIIKEEISRISEAMPDGGVPDVVGAVTGIRGEENRRKAVELTDNPDRNAVSNAWPEHVYHNSENVFETFYGGAGSGISDALRVLQGADYDDGQESYLGYDPASDTFVMGFDAFPLEYDEYGDQLHDSGMEAVLISLRPNGAAMEIIASVPGGMYPAGLRAVKQTMPGIIDVRLD